MSVSVELAELQEKVAEFGPGAFLMTVRDDARPHVVSVSVGWMAGTLTMKAGATSLANASAKTQVSLLWPAVGDGGYALIVDGEAEVVEGPSSAGSITVHPGRAVLHRLVNAGDEGPSCITVLSRPRA